MLCIVSVLGMRAQSPASLNDDGKYVFYNIGSGRYLGPSNSWGTQASLVGASQFNTVHYVSSGVYTLETQVSNGGTNYYFTGTYMDGGATNVTINDLGDGTFTMSNGTTYYGYDGSTTVLANNLANPASNNAKWKIMAYDEVYADASELSPADVSYMILDANFDRNNRYGGGNNNDLGNQWTMDASNQNLCGGDNTNCCAESWRSTFTLSQTITVPNGYYKLRAQAAITEYTVTGANLPVVYASSGLNEVTTQFKPMTDGEDALGTMSTKFTNGNYYTDWTSVITVTNHSLTVGARGTRTDTWCVWDNFQLQYLGALDLSGLESDLAAAVATAEATEGNIPSALYSSIAAIVTANNSSYDNADDYTTAINNINNAVTTYAPQAIRDAYSDYKAYRDLVMALDDDRTVFETGTTTTVDVSDANTAVEAATTVVAITAAKALLKADAVTFLDAVAHHMDMENNKYLDITNIFLNNADIEEGDQLQMPPGWETNYVSGTQANNIGCQRNSPYTNGGVTINHFIEAWRWSPALGDGYLRQTVSNLPEGKFTLEADAIAADQPGGTMPTGVYLYIFADGIDYKTTMATEDGKPQHFTVEFPNTGSGDVIFGLKTVSTTANWICADNFNVKFYGFDITPFENALDDAITAAGATNGTIPTAAYNAINTVVTANSTPAEETSAAYTTATNNILTAINTYASTEIVNAYANYKAVRTAVLAIKSDLDISSANTAVEAATTVNAINAALATLRGTLSTHLTSTGATNVDVTAIWITNPGFENDFTGWTNNGMAIQNNESFEKIDSKYCEAWVPNGTKSVKQSLITLGAGLYKLSAKIKARGVTSAKLLSGDLYTSVTISEDTNTYNVEFVSDTNGEREIGFEGIGTGAGASWLCIDNFQLTFVGSSLPVLAATVGVMEGSVSTAQTNAINTYNETKNATNYDAAITAKVNAQTSINAYTSAKAYLDRMETALDNNNFYTTAAYNDKYGTWKSGYDARTLATATAATLNADLAYQAGVTYQEANYLDDILLSAWTIGGEQCAEFTKGLVINTWSTEGDADGSEFVKPFYQYYGDDAESLAATTIVGTKTGLTASSNYLVRMSARVRQINEQTKVDNSINLTVGSGDAIDLTDGDNFDSFYVKDIETLGTTDASGNLTLTISVAANSNISWLSFRNVKYYTASDLSAELTALKDEATTLLASGEYVNITCKQRTDVQTLIATANPATVSDIYAAINNLKAKMETFKAGKDDYVILDAEKRKAVNLNVPTATINECLAEEAAEATKALKVAEYNYVIANYTTAIELGDWEQEGGTVFNYGGQHWSGDASRGYWEQTSANYGSASWNISFHQSITLPAGDYIFKVAGRHASGDDVTMSLNVTDITDEENPDLLGTVNDFPRGDRGLGINTSGVADFSTGEGHNYAYNGNGRGWEWRYVPFTLAAETEVKVAVTASATATGKWISFCDYEVRAIPNLAISTIAYNQAFAAAEAARDNDTYANVQGKDRADLLTAIAADKGSTIASIDEATSNLRTATTAFTSGVASWNSYVANRALTVTEKTKADAISTDIYEDLYDEDPIPTYTSSTTAAGAATLAITFDTMTKALKVGEYNYIVDNYTTTLTLGDWTMLNANNMKSQHWDGTNGTQYQEQAADYWASSTAWSTSYTQDLELPTGQYVFKVAGRHSEASTLTLSVTDVTDGENPVPLGSISDFPVGDTGRGIDTSGATNFSDSGTYSVKGGTNSSAVGGGGTGWEWRYVPFLLDNGEDMATIRISVVGANPEAQAHQWISFCNYTVQSAPSIAASTVRYNQAKAAAEAARDNDTYANVQGTDRSNLLTAIAADKGSTIESIDAAAGNLETATAAFIAGVTTWNTYKAAYDLAVAEKAKADAISASIHAAAIPTATGGANTATTGAADMTTTLNDLVKTIKTEEYTYVNSNYSYAVPLGTWTHSDNVGTMTSQHWDGTSTSTYMEQGGGDVAYNLASWTIYYRQDLLLPAGNYVFKVAGRRSTDHVDMSLTVTDITDALNPVELGTVNDFPKGDVGLGINTSGATDFTTGEGHTYANAGNGRGWEWRYVKFTLDDPATVRVSVDATADAQYRWMGFCNATVQANDEDNANIVANIIALNEARLGATLTKIDYNIGTGIFQYNETTNNSLWSAYSTAKTNADAFTLTGETTPSSVSSLTTALTTAQANYENQALNQPNAEKRYWLTIHEDGKAWDGNAITFIEGGRNDQGLYGIKYLAAADANLTQAIKLTPTGTNNNFKVSVLRPDGEEQYLTTGSTYGGNDNQIRTTDDEDEASWVKIVPTETDNQFYIYNVTTGTKIANNNNNDVYTAGSANFTIAEASKLTVTASAKAGKNGTVIFPFKPDVSDAAFDNIKFYTCDDVSESGYVQMTEVAEPEAKTPYLIRNDGGSDVSVNLSDYSTLTEDDYDDGNVEGLLTGVYQVSTIPHSEENGEIRYALQTKKSTGVQAFYRVSYTTDLEGLPAYKAYLTLPAAAGVKEVFFLDFSGMETDINSVETSEEDRDAVIYNLAGQRVSKTTKGGVYIVNGKKVLVK